MMAKVNDLLTVVLPLKGREDFTFRTMDYLNESEFPFRLIIADGSKGETVSEVLSLAERFPKVNYTYIRYPFDESYSQFYRKMVSALSEVQTPYVSWIDNDCLPVIEGLCESVEFLESHAAYSTCRGQHIDFKLSPLANGESSPLQGSSISIDQDYFDQEDTIWSSFEDDNLLSRISDWSHCTNIMFYNVHRIRTLSEVWEFTLKNDCLDLTSIDLSLALHALVYGKSKVIDIPFIMRQQNSPDSVSRDMIGRMDILDRMFLEKWTRDIGQLVDDIAGKASEAGKVSKAEAFLQIRLALKNHYADRLFAYLERRELAKRNSVGASVGGARKMPVSCATGSITISQPAEAHPALRRVVSFLIKDEAGAARVS